MMIVMVMIYDDDDVEKKKSDQTVVYVSSCGRDDDTENFFEYCFHSLLRTTYLLLYHINGIVLMLFESCVQKLKKKSKRYDFDFSFLPTLLTPESMVDDDD